MRHVRAYQSRGGVGAGLQKNVLDQQTWPTGEALHSEIVFWIEHTYNRRAADNAPRQAHTRRV